MTQKLVHCTSRLFFVAHEAIGHDAFAISREVANLQADALVSVQFAALTVIVIVRRYTCRVVQANFPLDVFGSRLFKA